MPLSPVPPRETVVAVCARALRTAILTGEYQPGSRLPPERTLAETFGVNRVTVRAALAQLETARLVSVRQGSGYVVRDFRRDGGPDLLPPLLELAQEQGTFVDAVRELFRMRRATARAVFEALVERETLDVAPIEKAICDLEVAVQSGQINEIAEADLNVVASLLVATGSPVLGVFLNPIVSLLLRFPELKAIVYRDPSTNVMAYRAVLLALQSKMPGVVEMVTAQLAERDNASLVALADRIAKEEPRPRSTPPPSFGPISSGIRLSQLAKQEMNKTEGSADSPATERVEVLSARIKTKKLG